ncbi:DJ-1/PfpI family protein [Dictyobacter formicarum]|uniref:AraC family transcriptional regulator n=1 Tax=Dictyobacter formicarum TaxID=2778368 RepID=A0ABQ3VFE8_9CHLR|nr:DJ-1/PfpI family protein [Dictyobacter formicarum]GHO84882.1 AraC family transcriptional regulator [Dictyobacter formicarum]
MSQLPALTVGILIFDEVEVLDFCGPFEVFSVARPAGQHSDAQQLFRAVTIAETDEIVTCRGGLLVKPHSTIAQHPPLDILVVPGGQGTRKEMHNQRLVDWIKQQDQRTQLTTSVCTRAFLLAEGGLLNEQRATTHWRSIQWMRDTYPQISMLADARVVDEGHIITSAGISAGIDMSLHVVERLHGRETAEWTARRMEYDWRG